MGGEVLGAGGGRTKKEAEQHAAEQAWLSFGGPLSTDAVSAAAEAAVGEGA